MKHLEASGCIYNACSATPECQLFRRQTDYVLTQRSLTLQISSVCMTISEAPGQVDAPGPLVCAGHPGPSHAAPSQTAAESDF